MDTTNEPVAWIGKDELQFGFTDTRVTNEKESWDDIPLYIHPVSPKYDPETGEPLIDGYPLFSGLPHPVKDKPHPKCDEACMYLCQMRELTDEEIGQIWKDCMESPYMQVSNPVGFARAILRKAQQND